LRSEGVVMSSNYAKYSGLGGSGGGGGGSLSLGNLDSVAPTLQGAALVVNVLSMQSATALFPGLINTTAQSFAGNKNFVNYVGINNVSPAYPLHVNGQMKIGDGASLGLSGAYGLFSSATGNSGLTLNKDSTAAYASLDFILQANFNSGWSLQTQPSDLTFYFFNRATSTNLVQLSTADKVGIKKTPTYTLDVLGDIAASNLIYTNALDTAAAGTLALGTNNATTVNIGNSGAIVNISGTVIYENTSQLQVSDPLITINKNGAAGSASNSGIEIEEAGSITGYCETSASRNSWILKAPNTAGIATITPGVSGITIDQSSHDPLTLGTANGLSLLNQQLSLGTASASTTGALTSTDWSTFNNKEPAFTILSISKGGTNSTATPTSGGVAYGTGSAYAFSSAGTAGQYLQSNGSGAPTWSTGFSSVGQTAFYGAFQHNVSQTAASTTTAYAVKLGTTDLSNGVSIQNDLSGNPTKIVFANGGVYSTTFTIQFANSSSSTEAVFDVWLGLNGSNVAESNTQITCVKQHAAIDGSVCLAVNFMNNLNAGDYLQLFWRTDNTSGYMAYFGPNTSPTRPETPSIILTTQQITQIGLGYAGLTSSTSTLIGTGSKTFTTNLSATSTAFTVGSRVRLAYSVTPSNWMEGVVTAFSGTTMTVNVDTTNGSGTFASWNISISANASTLGTVAIANGGTGQTTASAAFNALSPITSTGDLILGNGANSATRLAIGTNGYVLSSNGTTASWNSLQGNSTYLKAPTVQKFTSGSGTYTTPTNPSPLYIKVKMVGGGGGGAGSGTSGGGTGGTGGNTTFGSSLLTANGGSGGVGSTGIPGSGGSASLGTGPIGVAITGTTGGYPSSTLASNVGGAGGNAPYFAGGAPNTGTTNSVAGIAGITNTGGGGSGGEGVGATYFSGPGGGSGGFVEAMISAPSATYAYAVGAAGTAGTAGAGANAKTGGAGGSGYIIVEEYYQ
jgi:hypothetical protein